MELARIELKRSQEEDDETVIPFHFHIHPPSADHPQYGVDDSDPQEGTGEGA
jgi:hypothetical protein